MKAFLLTAAAVMACAGSMFAQNLAPVYDWEVGLNGGFSVITCPLGPSHQYQGSSTNIVHDYSLKATYFFNEHWFLSFDLGTRQWETFGTWQPFDAFGQKLKPRQITFLVADHAITESFQFNYVIPFYAQYSNFNRANVYFGAMLGLVTTTNDGSMGFSKYNAPPDSTYIYTSKYDYGYGIGLSYGVQTGFTYYIIPRLGVNVELAVRYAGVKTQDSRYASENNHFHLLYFPETIGLKWRF
ncbi:MAG: hypothetical protein ACHQD8_06355 [Chitinophagales bacterium]